MKPNPPEIVKKAERLHLELVRSADSFPVKHRHTLGADLRRDGLQVDLLSKAAFRASAKPTLAALVDQLSDNIDRIKAQWQVAFKLQCFSFDRSEEVARLLEDVGKQCGGWKKSIEKRSTGQNPAPKGTRSVP